MHSASTAPGPTCSWSCWQVGCRLSDCRHCGQLPGDSSTQGALCQEASAQRLRHRVPGRLCNAQHDRRKLERIWLLCAPPARGVGGHLRAADAMASPVRGRHAGLRLPAALNRHMVGAHAQMAAFTRLPWWQLWRLALLPGTACVPRLCIGCTGCSSRVPRLRELQGCQQLQGGCPVTLLQQQPPERLLRPDPAQADGLTGSEDDAGGMHSVRSGARAGAGGHPATC